MDCTCRKLTASAGIALITVLLLVALLSLLTASAVGIVRTRSKISQQQNVSAQAKEALDSAIHLALLEMAAPTKADANGATQVGSVRKMTLFGFDIDLQVESEASRVDLNFADAQLLRAVFLANGYSGEDALRMSARIVDWRDGDQDATDQGAERAQYAAAGLTYGPRNNSFEAVDEMRQVLGLQNVEDKVLEAFTVYSHLAKPRASTRTAAVQQALASQGISGAASEPIALSTEVVRLRACAVNSRLSLCRVAIVQFTGNLRRPWLVFQWNTQFE
jgi:general secretion pathway protein K